MYQSIRVTVRALRPSMVLVIVDVDKRVVLRVAVRKIHRLRHGGWYGWCEGRCEGVGIHDIR